MPTATSISDRLTSSGRNTLDARPKLEQALELSPNNARALYYLALVERREGHYDEEVADLQRVVTQYPQARDAASRTGHRLLSAAIVTTRPSSSSKPCKRSIPTT